MLAQENQAISPHLNEARHLVDQCIADTRTLSHLLHPPLLDEAGLASAAKWYVEGFGQRSGILTQLDLPEHIHRLPARMETALFRILQEALTNVHRHSGSRAVEVRIAIENSRVILTVRDFGVGVPSETLDRFWKTGNVGVGLAGIRERLKELGGILEIESDLDGTLLKATIPLSSPERAELVEENTIVSGGDSSALSAD
jgi:signal transduction histidine kinase